jgi:tRNA(Ile)-lysidine synthase
MAGLGPFEPEPRIAAGVSGGADSMALALLADKWARQRGGSLLALVVDHGLRPESALEAAETLARLSARGIAARLLTITGLARGSALAERARAARFDVLRHACAEADILHLLLGHHADDQAETVLIRALGGSKLAGLAGMAPIVELFGLRLLRPLLAMPPIALRRFLIEAGAGWVEDPSNTDRRALRPRLRGLRLDRNGTGPATTALVAAAAAASQRRAAAEIDRASRLAEAATLRWEGFALLPAAPMHAEDLAAVLQAVAGAPFAPPTAAVAALAAAPKPATLWGVRLLAAGQLGPGLLAVREAAAMAPPVPAVPGAVWDGRFRVGRRAEPPEAATIGALGKDATRLRRFSPLPSAVLQTLPAVRVGLLLHAVPHLLYPDTTTCGRIPLMFSPPRPVAGVPFAIGDA